MARNKELNQQLKDARREQLLNSALKLFATRGLAATKISDIAVEANMSQGLMYHYYRSKEEIFVELIRHALERMNAAVRALEKMPLSPKDQIRLAIEKLLEGLETHEHTGYYHLLIAQATGSDAIPEAAKTIIQNENQVPYEVMTRIIIAGQKDGTIKKYDPAEMALVFWTSMKGLAIHKATQGQNFRMPDPDILINMFI